MHAPIKSLILIYKYSYAKSDVSPYQIKQVSQKYFSWTRHGTVHLLPGESGVQDHHQPHESKASLKPHQWLNLRVLLP